MAAAKGRRGLRTRPFRGGSPGPDAAYVDELAERLRAQGMRVRCALRYGNPPRELVRAIQELNLDLMILGAHGHGFWADRLFGQTIDTIRHAVTIPVLAVREPPRD